MHFAEYGYGLVFKQHSLQLLRPTEAIQDKAQRAISLVKNPEGGVSVCWGKAKELLAECFTWQVTLTLTLILTLALQLLRPRGVLHLATVDAQTSLYAAFPNDYSPRTHAPTLC